MNLENWIKQELRPRKSKDRLIHDAMELFNCTAEEVEKYLPQATPRDEELEMLANGMYRSTRVIKIATENDKTPESLMKAHGYDPLQWKLISSKQKAWNVYSKQDKIQDLFSSTITVKPIQNVFDLELAKKMFEGFKVPQLPKYEYPKGNYLLEIPICDLHLAKLTWKKETGEDYDIGIAEQLYRKVIENILARVSSVNVERIVFPIGQDFFNVDNSANQTTKGTPQSMDTRWQKMYFKGCELVIWALENLRKVAPVDVLYVPGNHDIALSYFLTLNTSAWYRNCEEVTVDMSPKIRKYYQYYDNLIGYSHGEEKAGNLDKIMQAEAPELWGKTTHRELHLGHRHSEHVHEYPGFIVRRISSVTSTDDWHNQMGYVKQSKKAQAFLWHQQEGLHTIFNIDATAETKK